MVSILAAALTPPLAAQEPPAPAATSTLSARVDLAIAEFAGQLPADIEAIPEYVADHVSEERYDGVLKGPRGAFLTRRANSADQALLVQAILRTRHPDRSTRYAACPAPVRPADDMPSTSAGPAADAIAQLEREIESSFSHPDLVSAVRDLTLMRADALEDVDILAGSLAWALSHMDSQSSNPIRSDAAQPGTHVWIQTMEGERWIDLDPTRGGMGPPCDDPILSDTMPVGRHELRISLVTESLADGVLEESKPLSVVYPIADLATRRVGFTFAEPAGLVDRGRSESGTTSNYTPVLLVDDARELGTPLELPAISSSVGGSMGGLASAFSGLLGGDVDTPETELAAAWLRFDLTSPGTDLNTYWSEVFDRIGPMARLEEHWDGTLAPLEEVDGEYAALGTLWQVGLFTGEASLAEPLMDPSLDVSTLEGISGQLDALLRLYPAVRRDFGGLEPQPPLLLLAGLVPHENPDGELAPQVVLDALRVQVAGAPDKGSAARDAAATLAAEGFLLELAGFEPTETTSAYSLLGGPSAGPSPLDVIEKADAVLDSGASPVAIARIQSRLEDGYVVLKPKHLPFAGGRGASAWWLFDPATGIVRDEDESGRSSSAVETTIINASNLSTAERFRRIACRFTRPLILAAGIFYGASGGADAPAQMLKAIAKSVQLTEQRRQVGEAARKIACAGTGTGVGT